MDFKTRFETNKKQIGRKKERKKLQLGEYEEMGMKGRRAGGEQRMKN